MPGHGSRSDRPWAALSVVVLVVFLSVSASLFAAGIGASPPSPTVLGAHGRGGPTASFTVPGPAALSSRLAPTPSGPSPVGISDDGSGSEASYTTDAVQGSAELDDLATYNASLGSDAHQVSLQLNAFVTFRANGTSFDYWTQDVMEFDTSSHTTYFEDNLWNATSTASSVLDPATIHGNGSFTNTTNGEYYAAVASPGLPGASTTLSLPSTVTLQMNAGVNGTGRPQVKFFFDDGFGPTVFDTVTFRFANISNTSVAFSVNGSAQTLSCERCVNNLEFVLGGPYGGAETAVSGVTKVLLSLDRWGGRDFLSVPDADNYGIATAEALVGGTDVLHATSGKAPGAAISEGSFAPAVLWRSSDLSSVHVSVGTGPVSGTLTVNGSQTAFVNGSVDVLLLPGVDTLLLHVGATTYGLANLTLGPGDLDTFEVGAIPLVFVPQGLPNGTAWQVTLSNLTLRGTGEITFGVGNGTFSYTVGSVSGYTSSPTAGILRVSGSGYDQVVVWTSNPPTIEDQIVSLLELDLGPVPLYVILGLLVALGVVAAVLGRRGRGRRPRARAGKSADGWSDDL